MANFVMNEPRSIAEILERQATSLGDSEAIFCRGRRTSYRELDLSASKIACRLAQSSIQPQEQIAYLGKNSDRFYEIWFGSIRAGATLVALNFRLAVPELKHILDDCCPRLLFVDVELLPVADEAISELETQPILIQLNGNEPGILSYLEFRDSGPIENPDHQPKPQDTALLLYTSGTTGHPKGVQLTNSNWVEFSRLCPRVEGLAYGIGEAVMNAMPFFHVAGTNIGISGLSQGSRLVIVSDIVPASVLRLIEAENVRHAFFVPSVIQMLLEAPEAMDTDLSSLGSISYGASPIAENLLREAQSTFNCDFLQFYGMTETTGGGASLSPAAHKIGGGKLRSCGVPWPGIEMKVVDAQGHELPVGKVGEIIIKTPTLMKGYRGNEEATSEAISEGWMSTGDAAFRDEDGFFFICDRVKDMIVSGGENIYPAEVDNAIFSHPDVADVAVIGVPDSKWGEAAKAVVVPRPGSSLDEADILNWARARVANYKVPKSVDFVDSLPRNASGKILRRELRAKYWEGQNRLVS